MYSDASSSPSASTSPSTNTSASTSTITNTSPRRLARAAGGLYLTNIVFGAFALGLVPAILIGSNLATTAHNIETHEFLYRSGLAAHIVVTLTNVPMAVIFYELFAVVNRRLALLDACFTLVATAVETAGLMNQFTPLLLLNNGPDAGAIPTSQLQALAHLSTDLSPINYSIYTIFYGCDIAIVAYLVYTSTFLPKTIGALLAIDGFVYLANGFTNVLAPGVSAHLAPWTELPPLLGEGSLCVWLLIAGVNVQRWKARAAMTTRALPTPLDETA
ncbi:MAG TPA: DUF4386 domain-containing protein [Actinocrinis sp.]|jgi:hypothetical protein